jgi:hypothetical protein
VRPITVDEHDTLRDPIGRFLLGAAGEEERQQMEARLFADDEFMAELQDREDALIDDYAHGRLADGDRAAFERRFLGSPSGRARVAFARAAARLAPPAASRRATRPPAWLPTAAAVVFAIGAGLMGARAVRLGDELAGERARAAAREQDLLRQVDSARRPAPPMPPAPLLVLRAQGTRDSGETPELAAPGAGTVVIAVTLPSGAAYASYQAVLRTAEGGLVWEDAGLQPEGSTVRLTIPATVLRPGDYILTLSARRRTGPAAELSDHYFRVAG